jgi:carboxymethylenebutenolidase
LGWHACRFHPIFAVMTELVSIPLDGSAHKGALAVPTAGVAPFPGVVVIHDIFGFSRDLRRHCQRFADAGYVALGPDLYGSGRPGCVVKTLVSAAEGRGFAYRVIDAARAMLSSRDDVDADRIGVVGFCLGGGFALIAGANQTFAVAAPFYGSVPRSASRLQGLCPTIAQYGAEDRPFLSHARRLVKHLQDLGIDHEIHIYDEAGHSFMNQLPAAATLVSRRLPMRARYEPEVEAKAWAKLLDFFERHVGPKS